MVELNSNNISCFQSCDSEFIMAADCRTRQTYSNCW